MSHCDGVTISLFHVSMDIKVTAANIDYDIYTLKPGEAVRIESVSMAQVNGTGALTGVIRRKVQGVMTDLHTAITALDDGGKHYADAFWLHYPCTLQMGLLSTVADDMARVTFDGYAYRR